MRAIFPFEDENRLKDEFFAHSAKGFFVEVGANDPRQWSQSFHLEERGWDGILVEPQPPLADELRKQRRAQVYAVACSSRENSGKSMSLHLAGGHSSLDPGLAVVGVRPHGSVDVPLRTLDEILTEARAPSPLDLVSIDVEGHEIEVLDGFDLDRWRPRLILIEDLALNTKLHRYLTARGYKWVRRTSLNGWYVPAESKMRVSWFGRLQFFRKYYLAVPFRRLRETGRKLRLRRKEGRGPVRRPN
jgi:FkbM family methyltransferase